MKKMINVIEGCYVDNFNGDRIGVFLEKYDENDRLIDPEKISDDFKTKYKLCSGRCVQKMHYGILYKYEDGTSLFVCGAYE